MSSPEIFHLQAVCHAQQSHLKFGEMAIDVVSRDQNDSHFLDDGILYIPKVNSTKQERSYVKNTLLSCLELCWEYQSFVIRKALLWEL